jgi:hypothetical protein
MKRTTAQTLVFQHVIDLGEAAELAGVTRATARKALEKDGFASVRYSTLVQVRRFVEEKLKEAGFEPPKGESLAEHLWSEYDQIFDGQKAA